MLNPFHLLSGRPYLRAAIRTAVLMVGSLSCFAASAQTYPISGVWVTMDQRFPGSKTGACLTLKTLGADALFDGPFPTVIKDGSFHITESLGKRGGWLPWFKNRALHLKVLDPMVIEVTEGPVSTRFFKCSSGGRSL